MKSAKRLGMPVGNWLSAEQGKRLLRTVDVDSLRGKRGYAMLAIFLGCGLRRAELTALRVEDIQQRHNGRSRRSRNLYPSTAFKGRVTK